MLKRALLATALLATALLAVALTPAVAQPFSDEIFIPANFDPFSPESLVGKATGVACTDAGLTLEPLPDGAEGFAIPDEFLAVRNDDLCRSFTVPLRLNHPYKAIYVDYDLELARWVTPIFHNISSLRRTAAKRGARVLYYGLILRGDKRRTILDLGSEKQIKTDHPWQEHTKYHVAMEANLPGKRIKMDVFDQDGNWIFGTQGKMTAREIKNLGGDKEVKIDFSSGGIAFHAYFPPTGWKFSNLKVTAIP